MSRATVQHKLKSPGKPDRAQDGRFYSLTYLYAYPHTTCAGKQLTVAFHGLSRDAKAVYAITTDPCLVTNDGGIGVLDTHLKLLATYSSVDCYHRNFDGTREENYEDNQNSVCELKSHGGFTYFSFASVDADPDQRIGAIAVATRRVN